MSNKPRVAVVLSGCGFLDGAEIHESVCLLVHLSRAGCEVSCFAPDVTHEVIDHRTHKPVAGATREVLAESARISRGKIQALSQMSSNSFDALCLPGGFGAAKNLCDFASKGAQMGINPQVERALREFHDAGKPIGLCCIAPVLAAKMFGPGQGCQVTLGNDAGVAAAVRAMGATHVDQPVAGVCVDERARIVTTPAYMYDARPHEVYEGVGRLVEHVLRLAQRR